MLAANISHFILYSSYSYHPPRFNSNDKAAKFNFLDMLTFTIENRAVTSSEVLLVGLTLEPTLAKAAVAFPGQVLMSSLNITSSASAMVHVAKCDHVHILSTSARNVSQERNDTDANFTINAYMAKWVNNFSLLPSSNVVLPLSNGNIG